MTEQDIYVGPEEILPVGAGLKCSGLNKVDFDDGDSVEVDVIVYDSKGMSDQDVQGTARRKSPGVIRREVAGDTQCVTWECTETCVATAAWSGAVLAYTNVSAPTRYNAGKSTEFSVVRVKVNFLAPISCVGSCVCPEV